MRTTLRTAFKVAIALALVMSVMALAGCTNNEGPETGTPGDGLHAIVPDVVGMTVDEATAELENAGFEVGEVIPEGAEGTVVEQDPPGNYSAPQGDPVDLTVTNDE